MSGVRHLWNMLRREVVQARPQTRPQSLQEKKDLDWKDSLPTGQKEDESNQDTCECSRRYRN